MPKERERLNHEADSREDGDARSAFFGAPATEYTQTEIKEEYQDLDSGDARALSMAAQSGSGPVSDEGNSLLKKLRAKGQKADDEAKQAQANEEDGEAPLGKETPRRTRTQTLEEATGEASARGTLATTRSTTTFGALRSAREHRDRFYWNETPHRSRPPAMRGLLVHHEPEPTYRTGWAHDETIYNTGFAMWSEFDGHFPPAEDRFDFTAERMRLKEIKRTDYMNRWMDKWSA